MKNRVFVPLLLAVVLLAAGTGVMHASAISGSLPFVAFNLTLNGSNLATSTLDSAPQTSSSGTGLGDFSVVPFVTNFGSASLDLLTIGAGGGFSISNATYGNFVASSGSITTKTPSFLNVVLGGVYTPGPGIPGVTSAPAVVNLSLNQTGSSVSASFTLATPPAVPEPGTMALLGLGSLVLASVLRRRRPA